MKWVKSLPQELYAIDSRYRTLVECGFIIERGLTICSEPRQAADLADGIAIEYTAEEPAPVRYVASPRTSGPLTPRVAPTSASAATGSAAPAAAPSPAPPSGRPGLSEDLKEQGYRVQPQLLAEKRKDLTNTIASLCQVPRDMLEFAAKAPVLSIGTELMRKLHADAKAVSAVVSGAIEGEMSKMMKAGLAFPRTMVFNRWKKEYEDWNASKQIPPPIPEFDRSYTLLLRLHSP